MRAPRSLRSFTVIAVALVMVAPVIAEARVVSQFPTLTPSTISFGLQAKGEPVRTEDGLRVTRIDLDGSHAVAAGTATVYRVRVQGSYGPRALRYVIRAGGRPVAYGIPAGRGRAVVGVTADASVLTARITVRAGSGPDSGRTSLKDAPYPGFGNGELGSARGPFEVSRTDYDFGDEVFQPAGLGSRVELRADVTHPTDLAGGPFPLVLFLHGNHASCYRGDRAGYQWPCREGWEPLPNHEGYDYISKRLASYGFIVASVSGNGVNVLGNQVADTGMRQRGLLLEKHFDLWNAWNTVGGDPFGTSFVGAVDMTRTGVMGHSRGGEGAVWNAFVDQQRAVPYGLDAVLALAPVDFTRVTVNDVALGVDPARLRRRRVRPAGHPLLRRRPLRRAGRHDAQGDGHGVQGQPQPFQYRLVAVLGLPRRLQRRVQLSRAADRDGPTACRIVYIVKLLPALRRWRSMTPGERWTGVSTPDSVSSGTDRGELHGPGHPGG